MTASELDDKIASLVEYTDAILRGDLPSKGPDIDAEGLLSTLAQKINSMVVKLKTIEDPLTSAGAQTPNVVSSAQSVVELMSKSTGEVLDKSDQLMALAETMSGIIAEERDHGPADCEVARETLDTMRNSVFDIIASQSYQDVARQKMETMIGELNQIRDWLIDVLVIMNIRKDSSPENIQKKTEMLKGVKDTAAPEPLKQDLVDDLLAEFGF